MDDVILSKAICMHITTYENLNHKGVQLVSLIKQLFADLPLVIPVDLVIEVEKMKSARQIRYPFNSENLNKVYQMLLKGELQQLLICDHYDWNDDPHDNDVKQAMRYPPLFSLALTCNYASTYPAQWKNNILFPNEFSFALNDCLFDHRIPELVQRFYVELFHKFLSVLDCAAGFITYETIGASNHMHSSYEIFYCINPTNDLGYLDYIKGYYWMTYLSERHITRLGGLIRLRENAPGAVIIDDEFAGSTIQLTSDINAYSDDQLRVLKRFLQPLLPSPNAEERTYPQPGSVYRLVE